MQIKALLVGINEYAERPLRGCVNDVGSIRELLGQRYGAGADQVRVLLDAEATGAAILAGLEWLAAPGGAGEPELRIFQFAGHGTQQADQNGDEPDGADECLMPVDYKDGLITDDVLRERYAAFPPSARLLLLMDCCHSGTIQKELGSGRRQRFMPIASEEYHRISVAKRQFEQRQTAAVMAQLREIRDRGASEEEMLKVAQSLVAAGQKQRFGEEKQLADVVLLAACRPEQTAADARFGEGYHGALSFFLLKALAESQAITCAALEEQLRRQLYDFKFKQVPQLECSPERLEQPFLP